MRQGRSFRQRMPTGTRTLIQRAISILRRFGTDAHIYLPGVGMLNGLQAGNYIDSAGTTVGTVDQPVGLVLDAAGSVGVELVTNGDFATNDLTGWSSFSCDLTVVGGKLVVTSVISSGGALQAIRTFSTVAGKTYTVNAELVNRDAPFAVGIAARATDVANTPIAISQSILSPGLMAVTFVATGTTSKVNLRVDGSNFTTANTVTFDNISVREVTGIHATQPTTSAKPILRRGAVNLLTYSGDFSNAAHSKGSVTQGALGADPDGGTNARLFTADPSTLSHQIVEPNTACSAGAYTHMIIVKPSGYTKIGLRESTATGVYATFDCTGAGSVLANTALSAGITVLTGGFYLLTMVISTGAANYAVTSHILPGSYSTGAPNVPWAGDGVSGFFFYKVALFQGTYTAAKIQALGGIPTTLTAPVSTALGAYWWDTSGSKSLVATFPAGNESVTVINATPTGQVTTTAQNVVGAYSINTNTNGRIIVNGVLTASELATLQSYANRLAGL